MEEKKTYNHDDMYDGIQNLYEVIPEDVSESNDDNTYEGITELFEEISEDSVYEGISELFSENDDIHPDDISNDNISNDDISNDDISNDNISNDDISNDDNSNDNDSNNNIHQDDNYNESIYQDNNYNDDIHQDNNDGTSDMSSGEETEALTNPGFLARTREQMYEIRRLGYEERVRARITQEDLEIDGLNYQDLSELMLDTFENTLDEYDPRWNSNLYDMSQNLMEISTRREDLISNTNLVPVEQEVINMGMQEAFEFMINMCMNVYHLNIPIT